MKDRRERRWSKGRTGRMRMRMGCGREAEEKEKDVKKERGGKVML